MNQRIRQLKIHHAKQKLLQRFDFLAIRKIIHSDDANCEQLFNKFRQSGIWHYDNKPIASFAFCNDGLTNNQSHQSQHIAAQRFFIQKVKMLQNDLIWVLLSQDEFEFFVQVSLPMLLQHIDDWFDKYDDFVLFIPNQYALAIHDGEHEWEILEKHLGK